MFAVLIRHPLDAPARTAWDELEQRLRRGVEEIPDIIPSNEEGEKI